MVGKQISTPRVFLNPESEVEYVEICFCPRQMGQWQNPKLPHPAGLQEQTWLGQWRNEEKIHRKATTGWSGFLDGNATDPVNSGWFLDTMEQGGGSLQTAEQRGRAYGTPLDKEGSLIFIKIDSVVFRPQTSKGRKLQWTFSAHTINPCTWSGEKLCHWSEPHPRKALPPPWVWGLGVLGMAVPVSDKTHSLRT